MDVHLLLEHSEAQSIQLYANHHECKSPSGVLGHWIFFFPNPNASYSWLFSVPKARPEAEEVSAPPVVEDGYVFCFFLEAPISMKIVQGGLYNVCMICMVHSSYCGCTK